MHIIMIVIFVLTFLDYHMKNLLYNSDFCSFYCCLLFNIYSYL